MNKPQMDPGPAANELGRDAKCLLDKHDYCSYYRENLAWAWRRVHPLPGKSAGQ